MDETMDNPRAIKTGVDDRRRSRRRLLRGSVRIEIRTSDRSDAGLATAAMLNLSESGVACRVPWDEVDRLRTGESIRVLFRLHDTDESFDLPARIINITQAGTPGTCVIGMEFLFGSEGERVQGRLRAALNRASPPKAT